MPTVGFISIPSGMEEGYSQVFQPGDRFIVPHVRVKRLFLSRVRKKGLSQRSLMVSLAPVWAGFDSTTKAAWEAAGTASNISGWKLFVQDTAGRLANGLPGYATPNVLYQSRVGRMEVQSPATGLAIVQLHPSSYFVNHKVPHTHSQYEPKHISEPLSLPVDLAISYKADLSALGGDARARFFIIIYSSYQGNTIENICSIPFELSHDWQRLTASISSVVGFFRGYTAFIEIYNARGTLLFDNIEIVHSGINWARDPFCNSIQTAFTKAFYQIPKNWAPEDLTNGAYFRSVYHEI